MTIGKTRELFMKQANYSEYYSRDSARTIHSGDQSEHMTFQPQAVSIENLT